LTGLFLRNRITAETVDIYLRGWLPGTAAERGNSNYADASTAAFFSHVCRGAVPFT